MRSPIVLVRRVIRTGYFLTTNSDDCLFRVLIVVFLCFLEFCQGALYTSGNTIQTLYFPCERRIDADEANPLMNTFS